MHYKKAGKITGANSSLHSLTSILRALYFSSFPIILIYFSLTEFLYKIPKMYSSFLELQLFEFLDFLNDVRCPLIENDFIFELFNISWV